DSCFQSFQLLQLNSQVKFYFTFYLNLPTTRTFFPYTTLFRSVSATFDDGRPISMVISAEAFSDLLFRGSLRFSLGLLFALRLNLDRKSTRLNSSHVAISYAVFLLKKKNHSRFNHDFVIKD